MTDDEFKAMVSANIWHPAHELTGVVAQLRLLNTPDPEKPWKSVSGWKWSDNPGWRAKYVNIRIDMRDGGFILEDRDGKRISLEQIKRQERD